MLNFYTVKMKYIRNLMNIDHKNIMSASSQYKKNKRIFVGIIVMVNRLLEQECSKNKQI